MTGSTADLLKRITFQKDILTGKPTIRGLRISVDISKAPLRSGFP